MNDEMKLPTGKTCGDCFWIASCKALFGCPETNTTCDWAPSRFIPAARPESRARSCR